MKNIFLFLITAVAITTSAQNFDTVQVRSVLLTNATIHIGNGTVYENGVIGFDKGKITLIGDATTMKYDASKFAEIINCAGKHIYPGLIALNTQLGLKEIDLVRSTNDTYETGDINSNVRSIISYNTDSRVIPTIRTNGILLAQIVPSGGSVHGSSSVVSLDAWNWEDAAYRTDNGMHMRWPGYYTYSFDGGFSIIANKDYNAQVKTLQMFFDAAKLYAGEAAHAEENLKLEAMRNLFENKASLYIEADIAKEIIGAVQFAKQYNFKPVIIGGREAYKILPFLKENNVTVIITNTHNLPASDDEDIDMPYKLPYLLQQAGITYAISFSGSGDANWNMRNLPFVAGTAVAFGLTKEQALQSITLIPARILGIDSTVGSLESGKDATLLVCDGDILDMRSEIISKAYIAGIPVEINNWQHDNYVKYSRKYGIEIK